VSFWSAGVGNLVEAIKRPSEGLQGGIAPTGLGAKTWRPAQECVSLKISLRFGRSGRASDQQPRFASVPLRTLSSSTRL